MKTIVKSTNKSILNATTIDNPVSCGEMVFTDLNGNSREFFIVSVIERGGRIRVVNSNFTAWLEDTPEEHEKELIEMDSYASAVDIARERNTHVIKTELTLRDEKIRLEVEQLKIAEVTDGKDH